MKDGTELTHYGVKGMKWGKKLFGKVKGVFGKPNNSGHNTTYDSIKTATGNKVSSASDSYNKGKTSYAQFDQRSRQAIRTGQMQEYRHYAKQASPSDFSSLTGDEAKKRANNYANSVKRRSKRINGR